MFSVVKYANLPYANTVRFDNDDRRDEEMSHGIRKLCVGAFQFKVTAELKEHTWHKMPLRLTLDVVGLKMAVTTLQTIWGNINFVIYELLISQVFCTGQKK